MTQPHDLKARLKRVFEDHVRHHNGLICGADRLLDAVVDEVLAWVGKPASPPPVISEAALLEEARAKQVHANHTWRLVMQAVRELRDDAAYESRLWEDDYESWVFWRINRYYSRAVDRLETLEEAKELVKRMIARVEAKKGRN